MHSPQSISAANLLVCTALPAAAGNDTTKLFVYLPGTRLALELVLGSGAAGGGAVLALALGAVADGFLRAGSVGFLPPSGIGARDVVLAEVLLLADELAEVLDGVYTQQSAAAR